MNLGLNGYTQGYVDNATRITPKMGVIADPPPQDLRAPTHLLTRSVRPSSRDASRALARYRSCFAASLQRSSNALLKNPSLQ